MSEDKATQLEQGSPLGHAEIAPSGRGEVAPHGRGEVAPHGRLAPNVVHFCRALRACGLPIGHDRTRLALAAVQACGLESRRDLHAALACALIARPEERLIFDETFHVFWRDPDLLGRLMKMLLPQVRAREEKKAAPPHNRRLSDALALPQQKPAAPKKPEEKLELDARLTASADEQLKRLDFESMSADEWAHARNAVRALKLIGDEMPTRRAQRASQGRIDWRETLRREARHGDASALPRLAPHARPRPLVVLTDISGSMSRYSRMMMHFAHALGTQSKRRVEVFVFGTRLTRLTRQMKNRDPDLALTLASGMVQDWSGGTRIAESLKTFNHAWARRVCSGATVLLVTDGLEHEDMSLLDHEAERLAKSCARLIWLNPLLRYEKFEPRARGIKTLLKHVDAFAPCHNLQSLKELIDTLNPNARLAQLRRSAVQ